MVPENAVLMAVVLNVVSAFPTRFVTMESVSLLTVTPFVPEIVEVTVVAVPVELASEGMNSVSMVSVPALPVVMEEFAVMMDVEVLAGPVRV